MNGCDETCLIKLPCFKLKSDLILLDNGHLDNAHGFSRFVEFSIIEKNGNLLFGR